MSREKITDPEEMEYSNPQGMNYLRTTKQSGKAMYCPGRAMIILHSYSQHISQYHGERVGDAMHGGEM